MSGQDNRKASTYDRKPQYLSVQQPCMHWAGEEWDKTF
jgi:hypothetical protein